MEQWEKSQVDGSEKEKEVWTPVRTTRRQRKASGKNHWNPDFIYEGLGTVRERAASWSASSEAAVVERKVSRRRTVKSKQTSPTGDTDKPRRGSGGSKKKKVKDHPQGNQQKISSLFDKTQNKLQIVSGDKSIQKGTEAECQNKECNEEVSKEVNPSVEYTSNVELNSTDSVDCVVRSQLGAEEVGIKDKYLLQYGSDNDSHTSKHHERGDRDPSGYIKPSFQPQNSEEDSEMSEPQVPGDWAGVMSMMKGAMKEEMKKVLDEIKIELKEEWKSEMKTEIKSEITSELKGESDKVNTEINHLKIQYTTCHHQLKEMQGMMIRQDVELKECKEKLEQVQFQNAKNVLKIQGIIEKEGENCIEEVDKFFANVLKIEQKIKILDAFRMGNKGQETRPIRVILKNPKSKGLIFKKTSILKDVTNDYEESYSVDNQLSAKQLAAKTRRRRLFAKKKKGARLQNS